MPILYWTCGQGGSQTDYPAVGEVEYGVSYGNGTYTGTFVVPAQSDVRTGVGYGASGTEFSGSAGGAAQAPDTGPAGNGTPIEALDYFIRNLTEVKSRVSGDIYADLAPKGPRTYVVYTQTSLGRIETLSNEGGSQSPTFLVSARAPTRQEANDLALALEGVGRSSDLDYKPGLGNHRSGYWGIGTRRLFVGCSLVTERDATYLEPLAGEETGLFAVDLTVEIFCDGD